MINPNFITLMENTEKEAKQFFERHPGLVTPDALIAEAARLGLFNDPKIDPDLFKHLMKKYHRMGY